MDIVRRIEARKRVEKILDYDLSFVSWFVNHTVNELHHIMIDEFEDELISGVNVPSAFSEQFKERYKWQ